VHFEWRKSRGHRYLFIVENQWTDKGPRRKWQLYVGTPETLHRRLSRRGDVQLKTFPFGKAAALLHAATETGLLEILDRRISRRDQDGLTVGQYLFLQMVGRVERPLSREQMAEWFPTSALPILWNSRARPSGRTLRRYLERLLGTGRTTEGGQPILTRAIIRQVEEDLFRAILSKGIPPKWLLFDTTNFYTYHRERRFSKKGHSKERRADKNLTGLGLVTLGAIPVLSEVYGGNEADPQVFARVFEALQVRLERLEVDTEAMALVFDRGVNSTENFDEVLGAMHVIAALNRHDARTLLTTPLAEFHEVAKDGEGKPILGFPASWEGFGRSWRALVVYRAATARHQEERWEKTKAKVLTQVEQWQASLRRGAPGRSQKALLRKLVELIPKDYHGIFDYGVERKDGKFWPTCDIPKEAEARLRSSFGRTTLITDFSEERLSDEEFVRGYVARWEVEEDFQWLKDRFVLSVKPVWVWSDASVPGHVFLCVMGLMLLRYLQWEVRELDLSMKELLDALGSIRVAAVKTDGGRPELVVESMNRHQARVFEELHLGKLIPR